MARRMLKFAASLVALSLLGACTPHSPDAETGAAATPADPPAAAVRKPTVFDDQLKALDKAKAVEEELRKAQAERDKQIDEQSGG